MATIEVRGIKKTYEDGTEAVRGADLLIEEGEFLVLMGPTGCGKTTLLRIIAGLDAPTEGSVFFDGRDVTGEPPRKRNTAMVFQNYSLYPDRNIYKNIAFPLENRKMSAEEIDRSVREAARRLGITDLLNERPGALSGGQKQRAALARALVRNPSVFLLDEPFSNLDAEMRASLREDLLEIHETLGTTFLYVTHDQNEAMETGTRIAVMQEGVIVETGTPAQIYHNPETLFTAGFVGRPRMELVTTEAEPAAGGVRVRISEKEILLPGERLTEEIRTARPCVAGIRQETGDVHLFDPQTGKRLTENVPVIEAPPARMRPGAAGNQKKGEADHGLRRFGQVLLTEWWELMKLNWLFILSCLPVITIPAALTAMSRICIMMEENEVHVLRRDYWEAFRRDFLRSLLGGAALGGAAALFGYVAMLYASFAVTRSYLIFLGAVMIFLVVLVWITGLYFFPMNAKVDLPVGALLRNSFLLAVSNAKGTIAALFVSAFSGGLLGIGLWPRSMLYIVAAMFSLTSLCNVFLVYPAIRRRVIKKE